MPAIFNEFVNVCWSLIKWTVAIAIVAALVGGAYLYHRADEELRSQAEAIISQHYTDFAVRLRSAKLIEGEGIELRGLTISAPSKEGQETELVFLDEVLIQSKGGWRQLLTEGLAAERVVIRRPAIHMTRQADGTWNTAGLLPLPKCGPCTPAIVVEGGTITIAGASGDNSSTLTCRDLNLALTEPMALADEGLPPEAQGIEGTFVAERFGQIKFAGQISPEADRWNLAGSAEGLQWSPELVAALPASEPAALEWFETLRAQTDFAFQLRYDPAVAKEVAYSLQGTLKGGQINDKRLPFQLADVEARYRVNNGQFTVEQLTGRNGQMTLDMSCHGQRGTAGTTIEMQARLRQLSLDARLRNALPPAYREQWHKFLPAGTVDIDLTAHYDGAKWSPEYRVNCRDVSFTYHKFPYRLERGHGRIVGSDKQFVADLTAYSGAEELRVVADLRGAVDNALGTIDIRGDRLPIDQKLFDALPEGSRRGDALFQPRGSIHVAMRMWRDNPKVPGFHRDVAVALNRINIRYEHFPYPLTNVRGHLRERDGSWTFHRLEGTNDSAVVTCDGTLTPTATGHQLMVDLTARELALDGELHESLDMAGRRLWYELKPRGSVDATAQVQYRTGDQRPSVRLTIHPRGEETSIEPQFFSYRLDNLRGMLTYQLGQAELVDLRAEHGQVQMSARGSCRLRDDGGWQLHLDRLTVDRLVADYDLRQALPERLRQRLQRLDPQGPFYMRGSLDVSSTPNRSGFGREIQEPANLVRSSWNLEFAAQQANVSCGTFRLDRVNGAVTLRGSFDGQNLQCAGELDVDSVIYRDLQVTEVRGPLWIDDEYILLGADAARRNGSGEPRHLTAKAYGGTLTGDAWVQFGSAQQFGLQASLADADMTRVAHEVFSGPQPLSGKLIAGINLRGSGGGRHTLSGNGQIRLRDADIYRLPQMIALLKILTVRPPDTVAFTESDIDFWVQAGHVYFDRINFNGDAVSLLGTGQMNLDSQIDLTFYGIVGRDRLNVPIIGDVFRGASQQIMVVRAEGKLSDPVIRNEPFPGVNQALAQLQGELERRPAQFRLIPPMPTSATSVSPTGVPLPQAARGAPAPRGAPR